MHKIVTAIVLSTMMLVIGGCNAESHLKRYEPEASYGDWTVAQPVSATARLSTEATGGGRSFVGVIGYGCYVDDDGHSEGASLRIADLMGQFVPTAGGSLLQWDSEEIIERGDYDHDIEVSKIMASESLRWNVRINANPERYQELLEQYRDSLSELYVDSSQFNPDNRREEWQAEVVFLWNLQNAPAAISDARRRCDWSSLSDQSTTTE